MSDLSRLSLNMWTTRGWTLPEAVDGCVRFGLGGIGLWREKVAETGLDEARHLVAGSGLAVTSLCRGGFFTAGAPGGGPEGDGGPTMADNRRAVDEAAALNAGTLVLVAGGLPDGSKDLPAARETVEHGVAELASYAATKGVRLAIEPLHPMFCADRAVVSTLGQALDMCDRIDAPNVGVCVDTYHIWWDPQVYDQIARAQGRIEIFQVCDFLVPIPADTLLGRGHVGDGVADIPALARAVTATGYRGPVEVEIFNQQVWDTPGDETLRTLVERWNEYLA
jgi:sugar phosphate isomerase/epimerase